MSEIYSTEVQKCQKIMPRKYKNVRKWYPEKQKCQKSTWPQFSNVKKFNPKSTKMSENDTQKEQKCQNILTER